MSETNKNKIILNVVLAVAIIFVWIPSSILGEYQNLNNSWLIVIFLMYFVGMCSWIFYIIKRKKTIKYNNKIWSDNNIVQIITSNNIVKTATGYKFSTNNIDLKAGTVSNVNELLAENLILDGLVTDAIGDFKKKFDNIIKTQIKLNQEKRIKKEKNKIIFDKIIKVLKIIFFPITILFIILNAISRINDNLSENGFYDVIWTILKILFFIVIGIGILFLMVKLIKFLWIMA